MTTKEELHRLIDALPEGKIEDAARELRGLCWDGYGDEGEDAEGMTATDRAWLEADLGDLSRHEPYEWGEGGPPKGKPVKYVPGVGLVILDDDDGEAAAS